MIFTDDHIDAARIDHHVRLTEQCVLLRCKQVTFAKVIVVVPLFEILPEQIIRRPALSRQDIALRLSHRKPESVAQDPDVAEIIKLSKPQLYSRLEAELNFGCVSKDLSRSIEKILIRLSARPTPNRRFAGAGIVKEEAEAEMKVITLPELPPATAYGLNRSLEFRQGYCHLRTSRGEEVLEIPEELIGPLEGLPKVFSFSQFRAHFSQKMSGISQAKDALRQLVSLEIIVPARTRSLFNPRSTLSAGTETVLVFSEPTPRLSEVESQKILACARELVEMRHMLWQRWAKNTLWKAAQNFLNQHYDHGPVSFLELSEKLLYSLGPITQKLEDNPFEAFLMSRAQLAIAAGESWSISDVEWGQLKLLADHRPLFVPALSVLVFCNESFGFKVLAGATAASATKLLGRFGDHSPEIAGAIKKIQRHEMRQARERLTEVEIHTGDDSKDFLLRRHSHLDSCIELNPAHLERVRELSLRKLSLVKTQGGDWTIMDEDLKEAVLPYFTHTVTPNFLKNFHYSLLESYARTKVPQSYIWSWGRAGELMYLPRVVRNGIILALARWRLRRPVSTAFSVEEYLRGVRPELPELIFLTDSDQRLPLKRDSLLFRVHLEERWAKGEEVLVEEDPSVGEELRELVVTGLSHSNQSARCLDVVQTPERAENFLNYRLSLNPTLLAELFLRLRFFLQSINEISPERRCFFIIYPQPSFHLRLRFHSRLGPERVASFLTELLTLRVLHSYSAHRYGPELDRWGGAEGLEFYQRLSCVDSAMALDRTFSLLHVPEVIDFWLSFFFSEEEEKILFLREMIRGMKVGQTTAIGAQLRKLTVEQLAPEPLTKSQQLLRAKVRGFLRDLSVERRSSWIGSFLHLCLNRTGLIHEPSEEKAAYQSVLRSLMKK